MNEPHTTKRPRGRPLKSAIATPGRRDEEKENESPLSRSTGRASKTKAMSVMHKQADDIALFQKEMKRKGGVLHGGRRSSNLEETSSPAPELKKGKRKSEEATYDVTAVGSELSDGETQDQPTKATKKAKLAHAKNPLPPLEWRMMVTGDDRWVKKARQEDKDKTKLRQIGVQLTQDPWNVDILVAPKILRTRKFVGALASAPLVVDIKFLDIALKQNKLIANPTLLYDRETEERCGFKLSEALERAKINAHKLFRGWSIFVTKNIQGGFATFEEIVKLNGGEPFQYAGRTGVANKKRIINHPSAGKESQHQGGDKEYDFVYLVSGESEEEMKLWKSFRELAKKQDLEARIVKSDWLLLAAMSQEICWDPKWELHEK